MKMNQTGNYKPWEQGYYEYNGTYKKDNGTLIFCYKHYFSGKVEIIESETSLNISEINNQLKLNGQ